MKPDQDSGNLMLVCASGPGTGQVGWAAREEFWEAGFPQGETLGFTARSLQCFFVGPGRWGACTSRSVFPSANCLSIK